MIKKKTGIILKSFALLLILAEILLFFFLPVATYRTDGKLFYATMPDLIANTYLRPLPEIAFNSPYSESIIVPYVLFAVGVLAVIINGKKFYTTLFSITCTIASFIIFYIKPRVSTTFYGTGYGYSGTFDNSNWILVFLALYVVAIGFFFVYYIKMRDLTEEPEEAVEIARKSA